MHHYRITSHDDRQQGSDGIVVVLVPAADVRDADPEAQDGRRGGVVEFAPVALDASSPNDGADVRVLRVEASALNIAPRSRRSAPDRDRH